MIDLLLKENQTAFDLKIAGRSIALIIFLNNLLQAVSTINLVLQTKKLIV